MLSDTIISSLSYWSYDNIYLPPEIVGVIFDKYKYQQKYDNWVLTRIEERINELVNLWRCNNVKGRDTHQFGIPDFCLPPSHYGCFGVNDKCFLAIERILASRS